MPSIPVYLPDPTRQPEHPGSANPLPDLVKTPSGLALLEVQGTLNLPVVGHVDPDDDPSRSSRTIETSIGRLLFPDYSPDNPADDLAWAKRVYLYVGRHQRLTGEVKKLRRPLAVVRRKTSKVEDESVEADSGYAAHSGQRSEELEIVEVVRWKIIFSHRPEPVGH